MDAYEVGREFERGRLDVRRDRLLRRVDWFGGVLASVARWAMLLLIPVAGLAILFVVFLVAMAFSAAGHDPYGIFQPPTK